MCIRDRPPTCTPIAIERHCPALPCPHRLKHADIQTYMRHTDTQCRRAVASIRGNQCGNQALTQTETRTRAETGYSNNATQLPNHVSGHGPC
eukprot:7086408-Alexandrium_andersonii.AAC.1